MKIIDLHIHSNFSDGSDSPQELLHIAAEKNLGAIALTDHDTTDGLRPFMTAAEEYSCLRAIPGVEISAAGAGIEMHITGLFIDGSNHTLSELLGRIRESRDARNRQIMKKLQSLDYHVDMSEIREKSHGVIGRPHIAAQLYKKYEFASRQEVFERLLGRGRAAYVKRWLPPVSEAVKVIHDAGGVAIWAHPVKMKQRSPRSQVKKTLKRLQQDCQIDGIEAYYSSYDSQTTEMLCSLAADFSLLVSAGSDYHGENTPDIQMGYGFSGEMNAPESLLAQFAHYDRSL